MNPRYWPDILPRRRWFYTITSLSLLAAYLVLSYIALIASCWITHIQQYEICTVYGRCCSWNYVCNAFLDHIMHVNRVSLQLLWQFYPLCETQSPMVNVRWLYNSSPCSTSFEGYLLYQHFECNQFVIMTWFCRTLQLLWQPWTWLYPLWMT